MVFEKNSNMLKTLPEIIQSSVLAVFVCQLFRKTLYSICKWQWMRRLSQLKSVLRFGFADWNRVLVEWILKANLFLCQKEFCLWCRSDFELLSSISVPFFEEKVSPLVPFRCWVTCCHCILEMLLIKVGETSGIHSEITRFQSGRRKQPLSKIS